MSTFKEITKNTLTNKGEAISGRLVYTWLGGNESKAVYFGLKDGAGNWAGNLSTKGTSAFYLTSNVSGCTAYVQDSTGSPSTADANTAREIFLNIPSTTTSRTIQFSYNGITVLTVKQEITQKTKYNIIIAKPYWYNVSSNNISRPMYYLSMDNEYNEEYITKSGGNNVNLFTNNYTDVYFIDMELNGSNMIFNDNTIKNLSEQYNLEYVSGDLFGNTTNSYICSFPHGMYDSEQDIQITNLYKNESYNGSTIYLWYPTTTQGSSNTFICCGEFSWHDNINCRRGYYTLEA